MATEDNVQDGPGGIGDFFRALASYFEKTTEQGRESVERVLPSERTMTPGEMVATLLDFVPVVGDVKAVGFDAPQQFANDENIAGLISLLSILPGIPSGKNVERLTELRKKLKGVHDLRTGSFIPMNHINSAADARNAVKGSFDMRTGEFTSRDEIARRADQELEEFLNSVQSRMERVNLEDLRDAKRVNSAHDVAEARRLLEEAGVSVPEDRGVQEAAEIDFGASLRRILDYLNEAEVNRLPGGGGR